MAIDSKNKGKREDSDQPMQPCLKLDVNHCDVNQIKPVINEPPPDEKEMLLVLFTLLYDKVGIVEKDENKRNLVFKELCKYLTKNRVLGSLHQVETLRPIRERFSNYLDKLISSISRDVERKIPSSVIDVRSLFAGVRPTYEGHSMIVKLNSNHHKLLSYSSMISLGPSRLNDFDNHGLIEKGGFGFVFKMQNLLDQCVYAVKLIPFKCKDQANAQKILREVYLYANIPQHQNIVTYKSSWLDHFIERTSSPPLSKSSNSPSSSDNTASSHKPETQETSISSDSSSAVHTGDKSLTDQPDSQSRQAKDLIPIPRMDRSNCFPSVHCLLCIQMELCSMNLKTWLDHRNNSLHKTCVKDCCDPISLVNYAENMEIFMQIVRGVNHLHSHNLIHRDLKPQNILFAQNGIVKIGDFGLTTINTDIEDDSNTLLRSGRVRKRSMGLGTSAYSAPEQKVSNNYNHKADIYSLGLIAFEIAHPFFTNMERSVCFNELTKEKKLPANLDKFNHLSALILKMVQNDPGLRPEALEILKEESLLREYLLTKDKPSYEDLQQKVIQLEETLSAKDQEILALKEKLKEYESSKSSQV